MEESEINPESVRSMVEDFWRSFLVTAQSDSVTSQITVDKFEKQTELLASMMSIEKGKLFIEAIDKQRDLLFQEYKRSPEALKARLGLYANPQIHSGFGDASDHDAIINAVRLDYADLQVIARSTGSISERAEKVDQELSRRIRSHTAKMSMEEQGKFTRQYNSEYNSIVATRLQANQGKSGCAFIILIGVGISAALGEIGYYFL